MDKRLHLMAFKSSLDRIVGDLAEALSAVPGVQQVLYFDLDDSDIGRQDAAGAPHALVYQYITLADDPRAPLYEGQFYVGAKTTSDDGNYAMTSLLTDVASLFEPNSFHDLYDWSGDERSEERAGVMMITDAVPSGQMFEGQSGIRMYQITAKVMMDG